MCTLYAVNKTLLHNDHENPKAIVTDHTLFGSPYSVDFVNRGEIMSLYTTSKLL
jgi:hypothetical protein